MTRKKNKLLTFIFSLCPGAGEMYMGFFKQGFGIMLLFFCLIGFSSWMNIGLLMMVTPALWCYSFFHTMNLYSLSDEEFYAVEDRYIFEDNAGTIKDFFGGKKGRKLLAIILIVIGACAIWNIVTDVFEDIISALGFNMNIFYSITYGLPQAVVAVALIILGIYLIKGKKEELDKEDNKNEAVIVDEKKAE